MDSNSMANSETIVESKEQQYDFFFYGTLLVPAILVRVLGHGCDHFTFQDALLPNYTRHCVKGEDYPAVIEKEQTNKVVSKSLVLTSEEVNTRGTLVKGLSYRDVKALDVFEGSQYSRVRLPVQSLTQPAHISNLPPALTDPTARECMDNLEAEKYVKALKKGTGADDKANRVEKAEGDVEVGIVEAWVYVWKDSLDGLDSDIWDFETFMKDKASVWMGVKTTEYDDVDRHRALETQPDVEDGPAAARSIEKDDGHQIEGQTMEGFPDFGHDMLQYWQFDERYVNLNHGSYGSPPRHVIEAGRKIIDEIEAFPDRFIRRSWLPYLNEVRQQTASLIAGEQSELVIVPNATHVINTITGNITWGEGDIIVLYSTTYGAVAQTMKCVCDRNPGVSIEVIDVNFPCAKSIVLEKTEEMLATYNQPAIPSYTGESRPVGKETRKRVRMVVVDSISSNPGIVYPWEEIVGLCKKYGALSLVDAAHSIGQEKVDVKRADCDFFVSNCHKWLYSLRSAAVMYVPLRNQHLIRSSFPTAAGYESTRYPTQGIHRPWSFEKQFDYTGTTDWSPFFSITAALKFRESIGGEDRIMKYCHSLAVLGGKRLAKRWGTMVMDNEENDLTAAMVNVALPDIPDPEDVEEQFRQLKYIENGLFERYCFSPAYRHAGRWWTRCSAQVWNELEDFDRVGDAYSEICEGIRKGKHKEVEVTGTETVHRAEDVPTQDE